ncbi:MAG: thiosulfate oxidation carrier complex protein SoxZ [Hyphomicrobiales bacterium]|nr:thiosulfate oxidation carrier complex protein SoxZ [Hyphomicrobiales bacterium]
MASIKPRVKVPKTAKKGEVIEIKTLISHKMETGQRKDRKTGETIPRNIINKFVANFNGNQVFAMDIDPAVSANPYIKFNMKAETSGEFEFTWVDDDGKKYTATKKLAVN